MSTKARRNRQPREPEAKALESTLLSAADFGDLCWLLLRDFEGDVGKRAAEGGVYDTLLRLCPPDGPAARVDPWRVMPVRETPSVRPGDVGEAMLAAAARLRRVSARAARLSPEHRTILAFAYGRTKEAIPGWGELGAVALLSRIAHAEHRRSKTTAQLDHWLRSLRGRGGEAAEIYFAIRDDARALLWPACDAWAATNRTRRA